MTRMPPGRVGAGGFGWLGTYVGTSGFTLNGMGVLLLVHRNWLLGVSSCVCGLAAFAFAYRGERFRS